MDSMGSYSQVVVGGMLLVVAFFFGRYINQQPMAQNKTDDREELVGGLDTPEDSVVTDNQIVGAADAQKSLRERILSQRAKVKQPQLSIAPFEKNQVASNQEQVQPEFADTIVEPDFSHLQTFESAPPIRTPKLPGSDLSDVALKSDETTWPNQKKQITGRFSINRPAPDRMQPQTNFDNRYHSIAKRAPRTSPARPVVSDLNEIGRTGKSKPNRVADEGAHDRLVPVRERRGKRNPETTEYVKYTTVFGDTLHNLSTRFFGSPDRYLDIYLANRQVIKNPAAVPVNTEIRIPVTK